MKRLIFLIIGASLVISNIMVSKQERPVVVFAHGLGATKRQGYAYKRHGFFHGCKVITFNFQDSKRIKENKKKCNTEKTCFAQGQELECLKQAFDEQIKLNRNVLLAGVSRGAMCILSADLPGAVGLYAESPASSIEDVVDHKCKQFGFGWVPFLGRLLHKWLVPLLFKSYNPNGPKPIDNVKNIPHDQPVFITCTMNDDLIPASSSAKLVQELVGSGHPEVYFWVSDAGSHAKILKSDKRDDFKNVSNAFFKRCGIIDKSYDCKNGDMLLAECKIKDLKQIMSIRQKLHEASWKKFFMINMAVFSLCSIVTGTTLCWLFSKKKHRFIGLLTQYYFFSIVKLSKNFIKAICFYVEKTKMEKFLNTCITGGKTW